jgi:hypothetical protein
MSYGARRPPKTGGLPEPCMTYPRQQPTAASVGLEAECGNCEWRAIMWVGGVVEWKRVIAC